MFKKIKQLTLNNTKINVYFITVNHLVNSNLFKH